MALPLPTAFLGRRGAKPRKPHPPLTTTAAQAIRPAITAWKTARTPVLSWAGFGCITAAAFQIGTAAGLVAAGVSLLVGEALGGEQ